MERAVFFSGTGTVFTKDCTGRGEIELYTQTLPALRFLHRRGFYLVLVSTEGGEYKKFKSLLKDESLPLRSFVPGDDDFTQFADSQGLDAAMSFYITDGRSLESFLPTECRLILVLSGQGFDNLVDLTGKDLANLHDVCKDFYAAAFSLAFQ